MPVVIDSSTTNNISKHYSKQTATFSADARLTVNSDTNQASIQIRITTSQGVADLLTILQAIGAKIKAEFNL